MEEFKIKEMRYDENNDLIITTEDDKVFKFVYPESREIDTKKKRKRYRYIVAGLCSPSDPVNKFSLLSKQVLAASYDHCIRIELPDDIKLIKYNWDDYSSTKSDMKIEDMNPKAMYLKYGGWRIDEKLTELWVEGKIQPNGFCSYIKNRED